MITGTKTDSFVKSWTGAWNAHDINAILDHFSDDVENSAHTVKTYLGVESGTTKGKESARKLWEIILAQFPDLEFNAVKFWSGVGFITLHWNAKAQNRTFDGVDTFFFREDGIVSKVVTAR